MKNTGQWPYLNAAQKAKTVAVMSGKGGVGKTSIALKLSQLLALRGHPTLLIDCDTNLSNTSIKLDLPLNQGLYNLALSKQSLNEVLYKRGNFHLLSACNGSIDLFKKGFNFEKLIIDLIHTQKKDYDFIFLDCPGGLAPSTLSLSSCVDDRFIIVTPDQSSMIDSYSLIKILNRQYKIKKNSLILNKVSGREQYTKVTKTISGVVRNFLSSKLSILGGIPLFEGPVDQFDKELRKNLASNIHRQFFHISQKLARECPLKEGLFKVL